MLFTVVACHFKYKLDRFVLLNCIGYRSTKHEFETDRKEHCTFFSCNNHQAQRKETERLKGHCNRYSDSIRAQLSGVRSPVEARFSAPLQASPGAHAASYIMDTGSFPGVKRPEPGVNHPPSTVEVKERVAL
jgi:hypothetical protein